jgi:hypothetical protein
MSSKIHYVRTPLDRDEIAAVNRMLKAAGEVLVTRAMTNTCRPKYKNAGWDNCWFTQMFGGKANLNRMTDAFMERLEIPGADRAYQHEYAVADKLGISVGDVNTVISLFDSHSRHTTTGDYDSDYSPIYDTTTVKLGKVVTFLEIVGRWLAKRGIDLTPVTFEAHKVAVDD